ncbi:putative Ig domain-containing protein [Halieaceae bacterium]|nr:putative Ig domain-containing protein [Halieaceae bacterium]
MLSACGGGGSGGGGFIPDVGETNPLTVVTDSLPDVTTSPYSTVLEAAGGSSPYSWTLEDDGGTGLTLNNDGILSGNAPSKGGAYGLTVSVTDARNNSVRKSFTLNVDATAGLSIITTALPQATQGLDYTAIVEADGGAAPYRWTVINDGGTGFGINAEGVLSGIAPSGGDYGVTLEVSDDAGGESRRSFILTVTGGSQQPLAITTQTLPEAQQGATYSAILQAVGGQGSYMWTLLDDGGTGLSLRDDGVLTGTAPAEGSYGLAVSVMDDVREVSSPLTLKVNADPNPLTITTGSLPTSNEGERYAAVLNATGGTGNYVWRLTNNGGSGLSISADGVLSGITNAVGTFGLVFEVNDGVDSAETALTLTVSAGEPFVPLKITTQTLPLATSNKYAATLQAEGGTPPYSWSLLSDPGGSGLVLSSSGVLSGTTPAPGSYGLTVGVSDAAQDSDTAGLSLTVQGGDKPPVEIITTDLGTATVGQTYSNVVRATGGQSGDYEWTLIEIVPTPSPAPTIDLTSGVITWKACDIDPFADGGSEIPATTTYAVTIRVDDFGVPPTANVATLPLIAVDDPNEPFCP